MGFQVDLYDEGIAEAYVIAKKLSNHNLKLYKKCGMNQCDSDILNKPHCHYCPEHMMDNYQKSTPLLTKVFTPLQIRV